MIACYDAANYYNRKLHEMTLSKITTDHSLVILIPLLYQVYNVLNSMRFKSSLLPCFQYKANVDIRLLSKTGD
jgi:hypothetical protein